jgi:hypothetical protein
VRHRPNPQQSPPAPSAATTHAPSAQEPEPRWLALIATLAVGGIYLAIPASLSVGPRWLELAIVALLLVPAVLTQRAGRHGWNHLLGHVIAAVLTVFMIGSLVLLMIALPAHKESPVALLRSGGALWLSNVLVFGLWYWHLDAGGPHRRDARPGHTEGAFLFPQMTMRSSIERFWSPRFIDYLFLAFNTSTAFSPTDVPILSRWAKVMVMTQSLISLAVVAILLARGVNML